MSSTSEGYDYKNMLTKIRAISAFGTILREMMPHNKKIVAELTGRDELLIEGRNNEILTKVRHEQFDTPETRARTEKMPLVNQAPLGSYKEDIQIELTDAGPKGLGFGKIWHRDSMSYNTESGKELLDEYKRLEITQGRQGMPRQGQDVQDQNRPGLLGESSLTKIPEYFRQTNLPQQLEKHQYKHGSGINRWQLHGSYAFQSWDQSMPTGGAHSGGTSDIFLAFNCLSEDSVFGKEKEVKGAGLLVSSFMNFGGYHSFVETYPIIQSIAQDTPFQVKVDEEQKNIYHDMVLTAKESSPETYSMVEGHLQAYKLTRKDMLKKDEHTFIEIPKDRVIEAYVDKTLGKAPSSYALMSQLMPKQTQNQEVIDETLEPKALVNEEVNKEHPIIINEEKDQVNEEIKQTGPTQL